MTDETSTPEPEETPEVSPAGAAGQPEGEPGEPSGPTIRDRRRIDPVTGERRRSADEPVASPDALVGVMVAELEQLVAERTADLQRLQAEYANYKKRVDRDRGVEKARGVEAVVTDLLPVLDSIEAARDHEELVGGFKLVADELAKISAKYGLEVYGEVGEVFDPQLHEALMHLPYPGEDELTDTTISAVMQKGVKLNDRVLRPARVAVADPS